MQGIQAFLSCLVLQTIFSGQGLTKVAKRRTPVKRSLSLSTIQILNETIPCSVVDSDYVHTTNGTRLRRVALDDDRMMEVLRQKGGAFLPNYMSTDPVRANSEFLENFEKRDRKKDPSFHPKKFDKNDDNYHAKQVLLKYLMRRTFHRTARTSRSSKQSRTEDVLSNDSLNSLRSKRTSVNVNSQSGGQTVVDACHTRGAETPDHFIHMCTVCAAVTTLPEDRFPRVINEEICDAGDQLCFFTGQTAHGACKQRTFNVNLLRKKDGACTRAVVEGQEVLVDEWELYTHQLRVGCECMINKDSLFAQFVSSRKYGGRG